MKTVVKCVLIVFAIPYLVVWFFVAFLSYIFYQIYRFLFAILQKLDRNRFVDFLFKDLEKFLGGDDNEEKK